MLVETCGGEEKRLELRGDAAVTRRDRRLTDEDHVVVMIECGVDRLEEVKQYAPGTGKGDALVCRAALLRGAPAAVPVLVETCGGEEKRLELRGGRFQ